MSARPSPPPLRVNRVPGSRRPRWSPPNRLSRPLRCLFQGISIVWGVAGVTLQSDNPLRTVDLSRLQNARLASIEPRVNPASIVDLEAGKTEGAQMRAPSICHSFAGRSPVVTERAAAMGNRLRRPRLEP